MKRVTFQMPMCLMLLVILILPVFFLVNNLPQLLLSFMVKIDSFMVKIVKKLTRTSLLPIVSPLLFAFIVHIKNLNYLLQCPFEILLGFWLLSLNTIIVKLQSSWICLSLCSFYLL